ncbi:hypothetical protein AVEN_226514-1 [Araneus ventricosus]|uniref:Uncharacterized protein n=1 Tax=Araneus ventricosus TaxID=182803 RepID=A0A4Y2RU78_ARAVE|nr:hypothetical protein AVEN_226514-1 [Araneus ventricosus]
MVGSQLNGRGKNHEQHEGYFGTDLVILNRGQITKTAPKLAPPLKREDVWPIIGYGGFQEWPPRSPDLTPMDFFLIGYLKQQVYATPPPTLQDLQRRITDACANLTPAMLHYNVCNVKFKQGSKCAL